MSISRTCFDQIFYKNKVQNQMLDLLKVIRYEEKAKSLEEDMKAILTNSSAFLEIFTYSSLKITQVQSESQKMVTMKKEIE